LGAGGAGRRYWTDWILRWLSWIERLPKKLSTDLPLDT
jgi:hypothetical protein